MSDYPYYLGIDGGGTKCRARLQSADGQLLGEALGGPANIRLGLEVVWPNMLDAMDVALSQAGLDRRVFPRLAVGLGLAGITTAEDVTLTLRAGPDFGFITAATDAHIACLGAFSGRNGAIMISGTGSAGYAWVDGQGHAIGGWGFEVNDDGSAAVLGREAVAAALHGHDGLGPHTDFTRALMAHFGGLPSDVVHWATQARPRDYGALAPLIAEYAHKGDPVASDLLRKAANDLGLYLRRLHDLSGTPVCLVGGMADVLTPWLTPDARALLQAPEQDALSGALLLAHGAANGLQPPQGVQVI